MRIARRALMVLATTWPIAAFSWGDEGHRIVAEISYSRLTPEARTMVDQLLALDADTSTARDFASRATWADKILDEDSPSRKPHPLRNTALWHFADVPIDSEDAASALERSCYRYRPLQTGVPASQGFPKDCIVNKIEQFVEELQGLQEPAEKVLALKFLIHLVGDLHEPMQVAHDRDEFGAATDVVLYTKRRARATNLHDYWESEVVTGLVMKPGEREKATAHRLVASAPDVSQWSTGSVREWALETIEVARTVAYGVPNRYRTNRLGGNVFVLEPDYERRAAAVAGTQLTKAGVRLARILNEATRR